MFLNTLAHPIVFVFKIGFLVVVGMFGLYLLIVIRQVSAMNKVITQSHLLPYLEIFSFTLLTVSISLFVLALVIL